MILVTKDIQSRYPDAFKTARKDKYRVVWLENDLAYVSRRGSGDHDRYLVRFLVRADGSVWAKCLTIDNAPCKGCYWKECCSHIAIAIIRWRKKYGSKRTEKRAA